MMNEIEISSTDSNGYVTATARGNWREELKKLIDGEGVLLEIKMYPTEYEARLPIGSIRFEVHTKPVNYES